MRKKKILDGYKRSYIMEKLASNLSFTLHFRKKRQSELMPEPDFFKKQRYFLPEPWIIEKNSHHYATYFGSFDLILNLCPKSAKRVLDAGCGPGRLSYELIKKGYEVTGFDYSPRAIAYARILVPEATFYVLDLTLKHTFIKFENNFDVIIFREVLEHINPVYYDQILTYFHTLLNDDGIFIITVPTNKAHRDPMKHYMHFNEAEIVKLMETHKFKIKKIVGNIRYGLFYKLLFVNKLASIFYDLLAPPVLKLLSMKMYTKFFNQCPPDKCGRLIITATK